MPLSFGSSGHIPVTVSTSTTANPATGTFTCGANDEALVLIIFYASNVQRTGGSPTFGTGTFVQAQSLAGVTEAVCEIWYMEDPPNDATYLVSIPNANTRTLWANLVSITAPATFGAEYHVSGINETTAANPNVSVTPTVTGTFAVAGVATGDNTFDPTAQSGVEVYNDDPAAYGSASQYYSIGPSGTVAISWTEATSDDYGALAVVFREREKPITINLDPALLNLEGKQATPTVPVEPVIVNLQPAILSLSAKSATVDAPFPPTQVNLQPAQLSLSAQSSSIEKGEVTINLQPARLTLSAPQSDVIPGDVTVNLDAAILRLNDGFWWLAGSIQPSESKDVYQSRGATSYSASKINLIRTNDLSDGASFPTWDAETGWTFDGASTYLAGSFGLLSVSTVIVRLTPASQQGTILSWDMGGGYTLVLLADNKFRLFNNNYGTTFTSINPIPISDSVIAVTFNHINDFNNPIVLYLNGSIDNSGNITATFTNNVTRVGYGDSYGYLNGVIGVIATYSSILTPSQVAEVTRAINNLQSTRITIDAPAPGIQVNLQPAMLGLSAKQASVQKGEVSIALDAALLNLSGKNVTISAPIPGIQIDLDPAQLSLSAKPSTIQKGAVTVSLDPALLTLDSKDATIIAAGTPITINLQSASLSFNAKSSSILKGAVSISLDPALLSLSGKPGTIQKGGVSISLDPALLSLNAKSSNIQKGAVSIALDPALLNISAKNISIITPYSQTVNLDPALLILSGKPLQFGAPPTPPPTPSIPSGGGIRRRKNIIVVYDTERKRRKEEDELVIIS